MDKPDGVAKAQQFVKTAYSAKVDEIAREYNEKRQATRARLAARGAIMSGNMIHEDAKLDGEQIADTIKAQLSTLLEGYELHGVPIDDDLGRAIAEDLDRNLADSLSRGCIHSPGAETLPVGLFGIYGRNAAHLLSVRHPWSCIANGSEDSFRVARHPPTMGAPLVTVAPFQLSVMFS